MLPHIKLINICFYVIALFFPYTLSAQQFDAELENYSTTIHIKNNKVTRHHSYEISINNQKGEKFTTIKIPFSKMTKVSNINAFIKDINGHKVKSLNKKNLIQRSDISSISLYEDNFVYEFTLTHNQYPYFLCYEFEEQENEFLFVDYWMPILQQEIPTKHASLKLNIPRDYKINYGSKNVNKVKIDSIDNQYIYTWETSYPGKLKDENFASPLNEHFPSVVVVPQNFDYEIEGSLKSWQEFGLWQHNLIKDLLELPETEIKKINNLIEDKKDRRIIIQTLYKYLQEKTRYINISLQTGGLKPYPASYVAKNGYGDCKALSIYFKALLNEIGIDSYYCKINAGETIHQVNRDLPSQQSNHIILCVPIKEDTLWIDCTSDLPFEYTGTFIQNREVFVIDEGNSFFTKTPSLTIKDVLEEKHVDLRLESSSETIADFCNTYRGELFEILRAVNSSYNEQEKKEILRDNIIEADFEPIELLNEDAQLDSTRITLCYRAKSNSIYKKYGNDLIIKILPFSIPKMELPQKRFSPIQIDYPIHKRDQLTYDIPTDYRITTKLHDHIVKTKYGEYGISFTRTEQQFQIAKYFILYKGKYPIEEYPDFYNFLEDIKQADLNNYITAIKTI